MQIEMFKKGGHYIFLVDGKTKDFIAYNVDNYKLTNEPISIENDLIQLTKSAINPVIQKLKSEAWSSNCRWLFVLQDEGIYLINVYNDEYWLCKKHSTKFIEYFLNFKQGANNNEITEIGKYRLLKDFVVRTANSIGTLPKGTVLNINQIDSSCNKVISKELKDWAFHELPVEKIK